jgi:hypothetical protein
MSHKFSTEPRELVRSKSITCSKGHNGQAEDRKKNIFIQKYRDVYDRRFKRCSIDINW